LAHSSADRVATGIVTSIGGAVGGAMASAAVGALVGSSVPIIGTVIGAVAGLAIGAVGGLVGNSIIEAQENAKREDIQDDLDKLTQAYREHGEAIFASTSELESTLKDNNEELSKTQEALIENKEAVLNLIKS
jgi:phage tail tape-measure protein